MVRSAPHPHIMDIPFRVTSPSSEQCRFYETPNRGHFGFTVPHSQNPVLWTAPQRVGSAIIVLAILRAERSTLWLKNNLTPKKSLSFVNARLSPASSPGESNSHRNSNEWLTASLLTANPCERSSRKMA